MPKKFMGFYVDEKLHKNFKDLSELKFRTMADQLRSLMSDFVNAEKVKKKKGTKNANKIK